MTVGLKVITQLLCENGCFTVINYLIDGVKVTIVALEVWLTMNKRRPEIIISLVKL